MTNHDTDPTLERTMCPDHPDVDPTLAGTCSACGRDLLHSAMHFAIRQPDQSPTWPHLWPLCWTATGHRPVSSCTVDLTLLTAAVTCTDCLELIHS